MKTRSILLISSFAVLLSTGCRAIKMNETEVPANVVSALKAKFSNAADVRWKAEREKGQFVFEAKFRDGTKKKEVHITPDGTSVKEE
ncbi:MAG: hypothetical protein H0X70_11750 [Segetibacter sp.]|jgi:hypothetical protein|nr:hypothetical protein [Segetibacter sp.]